MSYVANFWQVKPRPRNDGVAWVAVKIEEGPTVDGPFLPLQTITTSFPADLTVPNAKYADGWFVLSFVGADGSVQRWEPRQQSDFDGSGFLYSSLEELREALGGDESDVGSAASLSDDQLTDALEDAQREVDARVPGPAFDEGEVPGIVASVTKDIAAYLATLTHRKGEPVDPNDPVLRRYDRAQSILRDIQRGQIELRGEPDAVSEAFVQNGWDGDLFTLDDLRLGIDGRRRGHMPVVGLGGGLDDYDGW